MITAISRQNLSASLRFKNPSSLSSKAHVSLSSLWLLHFSTSQRNAAIHPSISELLLHKHRFSPESASRVASVLTLLRNPENSDSVLTFLKESGFSKTQLEKMVERIPILLSADLEKTIKPKVVIFRDSGFSANDTVDIISNNPDVLKLSLNNKIIPAMSVLKNLMGPEADLAKHFKRSTVFLKTNLDDSLVPNVEFLKNCGVDMDQIDWLMCYSPRLLVRKPDILKKFVYKVEEMGISTRSRMFIHGLRTFGSMSEKTWELKVRTFKELGFSECDIVAAFRIAPPVFGLSEKKINEVIEVFLGTGKYKLSCIIKNPASFMYSIQKRYKPRIKVLEILESKNMIRRWPSLSTVCSFSEKNFYDKFVHPYLDEVGDVYMAMRSITGKREVKRGWRF